VTVTFTAYDRPVRAAFVGLGPIYDLNVRAYRDNPDVEVVALVDPSEERARDWPDAQTFASDGELTSYHDLDDDWGSSFRESGRHWLRWLRTAEGPLWWSGEEAVDGLRFALAAYASSAAGGVGVHPGKVE
jgi:predicted dehydrogenase